MVKTKKMATAAKQANAETEEQAVDMTDVPCDDAGPHPQETTVTAGGDNVPEDSSVVPEGLREEIPCAGGGDLRAELEELKKEMALFKESQMQERHGAPARVADPTSQAMENENARLGQVMREGEIEHLVEEPVYQNPVRMVGTVDGTKQWIPRPEVFDGTRPINEYLTHFEEVARVNEWSLELKRKYLGVSLRGAAQTVLYDFNAECKTYEELVKFLRNRFQPDEQEALYKVQLRNRRRLPGESLNDLAQAIRQLTRNAYPKAPVEWRETVAKDQFIETLPERELRHQVYSMFPKTLNDALARAVQLEAFYLEEVKKNKTKPVVRMVEEAPSRENPVSRTRRQLGACWDCGQIGHYRSKCPYRKRSVRARDAWRSEKPENMY